MTKRRNINPMLLMFILLMIARMFRSNMSDPIGWITTHIIMMPAIITGLSLHEFGHAIVSTKLGDPTPRIQGRVTINPMSHVDPMGLLCLIFAGFGWGIPVEINPSYYKHRRRDEALTAIAGVTMNFLIALVSTIIVKILISLSPYGVVQSSIGGIVLEILQYMISINIVLLVFNLLPVPPLDGFNLLTQIFNLRKYSWYEQVYRNGGLILLLLILFGGTSYILTPCVGFIYNIFMKILTF